MKKPLLLIFLMLGGLVLSYYYEPSMDSLAISRTATYKTDPATLNFYLRNLETRTFNAQGVHTNTLSTPYATQLAGQQHIVLEHPQMLIALHMAPWVANADHGLTSDNLKKVTFTKNVNLSRTDGIADVSTESLVFDGKDEVAYTQSAVQILARGSKTTADGVHIDLNREIIQLKDNVKTYYAPEASRSHRPGNL